jgi:hypothetical protein
VLDAATAPDHPHLIRIAGGIAPERIVLVFAHEIAGEHGLAARGLHAAADLVQAGRAEPAVELLGVEFDVFDSPPLKAATLSPSPRSSEPASETEAVKVTLMIWAPKARSPLPVNALPGADGLTATRGRTDDDTATGFSADKAVGGNGGGQSGGGNLGGGGGGMGSAGTANSGQYRHSYTQPDPAHIHYIA